MPKADTIFIVTPTGPVGGGMGRVADYMVQAGAGENGRYHFEVLSTRDERGAKWSIWLMVRTIAILFWARITGRLAPVHVNFVDRGSSLRKGIIVLCARAFGAKVVLHLHTWLKEALDNGGPVFRWALRQPFRASNSIVVLGESWRALLVNELNIDPGKIDILYNGVPATDIPRDFMHAEEHSFRLLFLGQLGNRKGVPELLEALARLPASVGPWHAVLAGNGEVDRFKAMASELGLAGRVTFTGWIGQDEVRQQLLQADTLVLPSRAEVLPLVVLEALGCGTPTITTRVGVLPELMEDHKNTVFVPVGNPAALATTLSDMMANVELRQQLSVAGQQLYRDKFSLMAFKAGLFTIYWTRYGVDFAAIL